ncbi:uncharacterized protein LOC126733897 [Anthonomus grandis grandis]|uniref:uncharacterized protein LOC126733897 n=1 Tax=Anthonomus grandis grandis TaxID=2921223 RepID=UPI0021660384|nr:uncharacterized protein LOC126733897 [Anthonomus grandis grandis]
MYLFQISKQLIGTIVPETCEAFIEALADHIQLPDSPEEWLKISDDYENLWNFPQCLGAIDGKHVVLQCPFRSGSEYYNYKGTFSIVLMAVVDAKYRFLYVNVGCQGRISDGGVFKNTLFARKLNDGTLNLPAEKLLPGQQDGTTPFVFVCDDAFPLQENLMKPFPGEHLKATFQRSFNYRLSRARRVVENAFGVMSSVFRVLRKPLLLQPTTAEIIVLTCCYLHNFLQNTKTIMGCYAPPGTYDNEDVSTGILVHGSWRNEPETSSTFMKLNRIGRKSTRAAQEVREKFAHYFSGHGRVPWQDRME